MYIRLIIWYCVHGFPANDCICNTHLYLFICYGLSPNTTPTHVGDLKVLRSFLIICCGHLPTVQIQFLKFLFFKNINMQGKSMQKSKQIQGATCSYDLVVSSSSRCLLSSCFIDNISSRSEPSSGLIASLTEPGDIWQGDYITWLCKTSY